MRNIQGTAFAIIGLFVATLASAAPPQGAIIVADQASLRAAPRDSAPQQSVLWQGEAVEVRGELLDLAGPVEQRILGMDVEVCARGAHLP